MSVQPVDKRATCPICLRRITVDEQRFLRRHNRKKSYRSGFEAERCPGSGQQPLDQSRLDLGDAGQR